MWVIMSGEFGEEGFELGLELGDAVLLVRLFGGDDVQAFDGRQHLFVVGRRVDLQRLAFGRLPDGAVFVGGPSDVFRVDDHVSNM